MIVERVIEFRRKFGLPIPHEPTDIPPSDLILSCGFLEEEIIEFRTAMELRLIDARTEDDAAMFDALIDLVYFAVGMAINRGWDFEEGFMRVHEANMAKELAGVSDNKRQSPTDLIKPQGWQAASLHDLVQSRNTTAEEKPCEISGSSFAESRPSEQIMSSSPVIVRSSEGLLGVCQTG